MRHPSPTQDAPAWAGVQDLLGPTYLHHAEEARLKVHTTKPAGVQDYRRTAGQDLASAVLGAPVELVQEGERWRLTSGGNELEEQPEGWAMVDPATGEVGEIQGPARALRYAALLARAAAPDNHLVGVMDGGDSGKFMGSASLWKSSLRIDPNWAETMRRRTRQTARKAMKQVKKDLPENERIAMDAGWNWRLGFKLVTLTMPHHGLDTMAQLQLFNGAFRRFSKMPEWSRVWAGVKGVEDRITPAGSHVHCHFLLLSRRLDRSAWRMAWRDALQAQAEDMGIILDWHRIPDGLPMIDIREVKKQSKHRAGQTVTEDEALNEVSKYITKTADLIQPGPDGERVSPSVLVALCDVARWPRMFELLGKARSRKPAPAQPGACLDTSCISAAEEPAEEPPSWYSESWEPEEEAELESRIRRYAAECSQERKRPPSWRSLMLTKDLGSWLRIVMERAERGARFRLRWLKDHNPTAYLVDFLGNVVLNQAESDEWLGMARQYDYQENA